jgi:phosphatidylserine/phosphatidylglycerophosphate/cardiolipin synthase-like enzyme
MEEVTANISFDRFADMPEFYGSGAASYRLAMVKRREDFLDIFEGAAHVDAITYADTPELMVRMLTEYDIGSLDVLVGNADDYAEQVNEVATARELVDLRQQDRLTVRLKNQKTVHSKMYRVVMPDETVKLIHGSANLSVNSWQYHTNQISVITTEAGTELDEGHCLVSAD